MSTRLTARALFGLDRPCDPPATRPLSPVAAECLLVGLEGERIRRCLAVATFDGMQETLDPGVSLESWTLRVALGEYPVGCTVGRPTLDRLLAEAQPPAVLGAEVAS